MEVLMAVMIMAIGVVSVATMFPLSMLKSIEATQKTSATLLRYNAESQIDANKLLIFDPDGDRDRTNFPEPITDQNVWEHFGKTYVIDPIGYYTLFNESSALYGTLGNDGSAPVGKIARFPGTKLNDEDGINSGTPDYKDGIIRGRIVSGLPDSWQSQVETTAVSISTSRKTLTLPTTVDLSGLSSFLTGTAVKSGVPPIRIVMFDAFSQRSQTRVLTGIDTAGKTVTWTDRLPDGMGTPGSVRIETLSYKYTWMLMVRRSASGDASIDVVSFQGRPFTAEDEFAWTRSKPGDAPTDPVFSRSYDGGETAYVRYETGKTRPAIHKGGFVLDVQNAHWYRIQSYRETALSGGLTEIRMQLNQKVASDGKWAVFMRGVIDVYPIGTKAFAGVDQP